MNATTIFRSPSAIAVGVFFSGVTAYVLLEDCFRHGAPFTTKHLMTLAVLAGTVYFGHVLSRELRAWHVGNALGCLALFLAGTSTCVLMSAGRNAEAVATKTVAANSVNTDRDRAYKDHAEAKARYLAAMKAEEVECASGQGDKCWGKRTTTKLRRDDLELAERLLRAQQPEQVANPDVKAAASLLARLPYVSADESSIEALLLLVQPFLLSLFCECGAIVGFSIGLGHAMVRTRRTNPDEPFISTTATNRSYNPDAWDRESALADLLAYISKHGSVPNQEFLKDRWGLRSKSTVSTWLKAWEARGRVGRQMVGRDKVTLLPS